MVTVASLADCQALYRLSRWNGQYWWYVYQSDIDGYVVKGEHEAPFTTSTYPAYDATCLLQMLPGMALMKQGNGAYRATWHDYTGGGRIERESRTNVANALCRLAVALYEAGVLIVD